jgi:hypothetical protein
VRTAKHARPLRPGTADLAGDFVDVVGMRDQVKAHPEIGVARQTVRRPQQFELHGVSAFVTRREAIGVQQGQLVREAVAPVMRAIDAAQRNPLARMENNCRGARRRGRTVT